MLFSTTEIESAYPPIAVIYVYNKVCLVVFISYSLRIYTFSQYASYNIISIYLLLCSNNSWISVTEHNTIRKFFFCILCTIFFLFCFVVIRLNGDIQPVWNCVIYNTLNRSFYNRCELLYYFLCNLPVVCLFGKQSNKIGWRLLKLIV